MLYNHTNEVINKIGLNLYELNIFVRNLLVLKGLLG